MQFSSSYYINNISNLNIALSHRFCSRNERWFSITISIISISYITRLKESPYDHPDLLCPTWQTLATLALPIEIKLLKYFFFIPTSHISITQ